MAAILVVWLHANMYLEKLVETIEKASLAFPGLCASMPQHCSYASLWGIEVWTLIRSEW